MRSSILLAAAVAACFSTLSFAAAPAPAPAPAAPLKVLLLPSDVKIYNLTAGGSLDIQPDASNKAAGVLDTDLKSQVSAPRFQIVEMPALSADEQATLKEHLALYKTAATEAQVVANMGGDWKAALDRFDYSVGPGLQFLKQRTGADVALMMFGGDGESTGGRVAMTFFLAAFGIGIGGGRNYMYAGLVDLNTGNIVWLDNNMRHVMSNFTDDKVLNAIVGDVLGDYPKGSVHNSSASASK